MAKIYGVLRNATGIRPNTKIILTAARTSTQVVIFAPDRLVTTDANGRYDIECNVCSYLVTIMQDGFPLEHVGNINVYADSASGTLESFLINHEQQQKDTDNIEAIKALVRKAEDAADKAEHYYNLMNGVK